MKLSKIDSWEWGDKIDYYSEKITFIGISSKRGLFTIRGYEKFFNRPTYITRGGKRTVDGYILRMHPMECWANRLVKLKL